MTAPNPVVAEIRRLQHAEQEWRAQHPELRLRFALLDLITSCCFQSYPDHAVADDVALLDRAVDLLDDEDQARLGTAVEEAAIACVRRLDRDTARRHDVQGDLDAQDALRGTLVTVPPQVLLGRDDDEAAPDTVCWNEAHGLAEGISRPYHCASRIAALAYFSAPDRLGLIDEMVALRDRYEARSGERAELDEVIRARIARYLEDVAARP
ncbi:hypothetical protein ACQPX6_29700 [Actinomycetospora sp. CA-101289]|uniref:hypothetical protein n=1 Tax=Actinomycetospora sp. CA-101289 TaxID=3239893 RepID=UPI003D972F01